MQSWTRRPWTWLLLAYVAVPALVVAIVANVLAYTAGRVDVRVSGTLSLSVLTGNEFEYRLNAYVSDLDAALGSPEVDRAIEQALGGTGRVQGLRGERAGEASRVSLELTAAGEEQGAAALLAAGRTALRLVALQEQRMLVARRASVQRALQTRLAAGERLAAAPLAVRIDLVNPLRDARERAVDQALRDLAEVEGQLAVVRELLTASTVPGVSVDEVVPVDPLGRAVRTSATGGLAAALIGAVVLYARHGSRLHGAPPAQPDRGRPGGDRPGQAGRSPLRFDEVEASA